LERRRGGRAARDARGEAGRRRRWPRGRTRAVAADDARRPHRRSPRIASRGTGCRVRPACRPREHRGGGARRRRRGISPARDHLRSSLADAARSGIVKIDLDGAAAEHAHDTTVYSLAEPVDATPLDDRLEWGMWGLLSASRDIETRTLLRRAYGLFRDVETPDRELIERCIAAYGHQSDDGRWRLRDEDALVRRQADQTLL